MSLSSWEKELSISGGAGALSEEKEGGWQRCGNVVKCGGSLVVFDGINVLMPYFIIVEEWKMVAVAATGRWRSVFF